MTDLRLPPGFELVETAPPAVRPPDGFELVGEPQPQGPPIPADYREPKGYSGSVLPFSIGPDGRAQFDSNAGILGGIKRAFTYPADVAAGRKAVPETMGGESNPAADEAARWALEAGSIFTPTNPAIRAGDKAIPSARAVVEPGKVERTTNLTSATPGREVALPGQTVPLGPRVEIRGPDTVRYEPSLAVRPEAVKPPTSTQLQAAYRQGYDNVRDMGVDYAAPRVAEMARGLKLDLEKEGILANLAPKTHHIVDGLSTPPEGGVAPIAGLESARRALLNVGSDPTEREAARRAINALDDFYKRAAAPGGEGLVVAGPAAAAAEQQAANRGNYAAFKRSRDLTGIEYATGLRTKATNSGLNLDNNVRGKVTSLLTNENKVRGYNPEEIAALEKVVEGDRVRNSLRFYSNLAGGGGGMGAVVSGAVAGTAGGSVGGVPVVGGLAGAAIPASGVAARLGAGALAKRSMRLADELIRSRSPLYEQMMNDPKMQVISPERRAALVRALLAAGQQQGGAQEPSTFNGAP
jgi:hypothetical protein